ncbi:hypothetical protein V502_08489 [Pseudogymnoascus sp. VKM F-4520 (FW-2644)]|nr:hypothetical protein V502_08489 [Pseudogymnoascus sp. VKM F-4520 (FW-2644)]
MIGNASYRARIPAACEGEVNAAANPPSGPSCFTSVFSTIAGLNETFRSCCPDNEPEIYGGETPCFQFCKASDFATEKVMYECLDKSGINYGCTGKRDAAGNFSGAGPARSLSVGGMVVAGLALVGMLNM